MKNNRHKLFSFVLTILVGSLSTGGLARGKNSDFVKVVIKETQPQWTSVYGVKENGEEVFLFDEKVKVRGIIKSLGLPPPSGRISAAELSPDRRKIFFGVIPRAGHHDWIGLYHFNGKQASYLRNAIVDSGVAWHPDSCRIAFQADSYAGDVSIGIINVCREDLAETWINGKIFHEQGFYLKTDWAEIQCREPRWSDDGRFLYLRVKFLFDKSAAQEEWMWDMSTKVLTKI